MSNITGTSGSDILFFEGALGQLTITLVNPYSGESVDIDDEKNINTATYDGLGGNDVLLMSSMGDALFLLDYMGNQLVTSVETFIAGNGGDVINLASATILYGDTSIDGGAGDDILWGNAGNDTISASSGNDIVDGGPGNDTLTGGQGNDVLSGGTGNDRYIYNAGDGADTIHDLGGSDTIELRSGLQFSNLTFSRTGYDLHISTDGSAANTITIAGQYAPGGATTVESVYFQTGGTTFNLAGLVVNNAPVAHNDQVSTNEDTVLTGNVLVDNGSGTDSDANGDTLVAVAGNFASLHGGTVALSASGDFIYTPAANFNGTDSFSYTVQDGFGGGSTATVTVNVASVNDAPVAHDDLFTGTMEIPLVGNVLADHGAGADSDVDGDSLSVQPQVLASAEGATVEILANGDFTYTPAAGDFFVGTDSFSYTLLDGHGGSDTATVLLNINAAPGWIVGSDAGNTLYGGTGADSIAGRMGNDTLIGGAGNDRLYGGAGNDTLYGGTQGDDSSFVTTVVQSHHFSDAVLFPGLQERQNVGMTQAYGIAHGDLSVEYATTATIKFLESGAGYNNTLGFYSIKADGTIQGVDIAFANVKDYTPGTEYTVNLPGSPDTDFGFFVIADGDRKNGGYDHLDLQADHLHFYYKYGTADQRVANIADDGKDISLVYEDGVTTKVLSGDIYHTTGRDGGTNLNPDHAVHVVSGLVDGSVSTLDASKFDIGGNMDTLHKNGISVSVGTPLVSSMNEGNLVWVAGNGGGIGISGNGANTVGKPGEVITIGFDHAATSVTFTLADILSGEKKAGIDYKIYLTGDPAHPVTGEFNIGTTTISGGKIGFTIDASHYGAGATIDHIDLYSIKNGSLGTATFLVNNVTATHEVDANDSGTLRIGFEDLKNLGDADFNDVVFDLNVASQSHEVTLVEDNDVLLGGDGNDTLYGGTGDDILDGGAGADHLYGGQGMDQFLLTVLDGQVDTIHDFHAGAGGDVLNITDILDGYDSGTGDLNDFVKLVTQGSDTVVQVNADGHDGGTFAAVAIIQGGTDGASLADLLAAGNLVADHSVSV